MRKFICCLSALALLAPLSAAYANPVGGSMSGVYRAPAHGMAMHWITYRGGEQADFSFAGDGDTTLNVIVKDENGREVVRTTGPGDRGHVSWTPSRTQVYTIYIVNPGSVYNEYHWRAY